MTLTRKDRDRFWDSVEALKVARPAVKDILRRKLSFVKPVLKIRARHMRGETVLRHASLTKML